MVKSNFSLGSILLTIVLTIVVFIGAIAGTIIAVYKTVKVSTITSLFGDKQWISQEYDGTVEDFVKNVSSALKGEISIDKLIEISPALEEYADLLVDNIEQNGLFKVDRDALYSTNVSQLSANIAGMLVITASLNDLAEQFSFALPDIDIITGNTEKPLHIYTQVNTGESGALDKAFDGRYSDTEYTFYTRAESFSSTYTDEDEALKDILQRTQKSLYTLQSVQEDGAYYKLNGATLYLERTEGSSTVRRALTKNNDAVYSAEGGTVVFALADNERIATRTGPDAYTALDLGQSTGSAVSYEIAAPYRYKPLFAEETAAPEGGEPMGDVPQTGDYYEANGKYYVLVTQTDGNGNYVADTENGGFAIAEDYTEDYTAETLFALEYVYTEAEASAAGAGTPLFVCTDGIGGLPLTSALNAFAQIFDLNTLTLAEVGEYFGTDLSGDILDSVRYVPLAYLSGSMGAELNGIYIKDVLSVTAESSPILLTLAYGEEGVDFEIIEGNIVMLGGARPKTIGDLSLSLDDLKISSLIDIVTDKEAAASGGTLQASHPLMQAIADWTINDFSQPNKIGSLTIGQVIDIVTEEEAAASGGTLTASPQILQLLADVPIDGKELGAAIDGFTLGEILGEEATSDGFLSYLKNSTLDTLSDDLKNLTVQQMFADSIYGYHTVAQLQVSENSPATFEGLQALYNQYSGDYNGLLYVYVNGSNLLFTDYAASYNSGETTALPTSLLSPYILVSGTGAQANYSGVPLYRYDSATNGYVPATGITGWKLPDGQSASTYYTDREGKNPAVAVNGLYTTDTLYLWDASSESMKKVSLIPAAYGTDSGTSADVKLYARLQYAGTFSDFSDLPYGNLFWYDIEKDSWTQVSLKAENGKYVLSDPADAAFLTDKALYTYGKPAGAWKYLLTQEEMETSCKVQDIATLMTNVQANISTLTLRDLYEDGMVTITPPDDNTTPEQMLNTNISRFAPAYKTLGDLTLDGMVNLIFGIASGSGFPGIGG